MSQRLQELKPFFSVVIIIVTLFSLVFMKMEVRRLGYTVLKLSREERRWRDYEREEKIRLAKVTRPDRVQKVAQDRLTLRKAGAGQIIQITAQGIALEQ